MKRKAASKSQVTDMFPFKKAAVLRHRMAAIPISSFNGRWPFFTEAKADARGEMLMALVREELKLAKTRFALKEVFRPGRETCESKEDKFNL